MKKSFLDIIAKRLPWAEIQKQAKAIVLKQARSTLSNEAKMDAAVEQLAGWLDAQVDWTDLGLGPVGIAIEAADGPAIKWLLRGVLEAALQEVREAGAKS